MTRAQLIWLFFGFSGRISRQVYLLAQLFVVLFETFLYYRFTLEPLGSEASQFWATGFWAAFLVSQWCNVALAVKRLHDFGRPGLFAIMAPFFLIIVLIVLSIIPGTPGPNQYGAKTNERR